MWGKGKGDFSSRQESKVFSDESLFMRLLLLLLFCLCSVCWAEDPGQSFMAVLDARNGEVLGHYLMDRVVQEQVIKGTEVPGFPYTRRFIKNLDKPTYIVQFKDRDPHDKIAPGGGKRMGDVDVLGTTPNGTAVAVRGPQNYMAEGAVALGVVRQGRFQTLVPETHRWFGGRSSGFEIPHLAVAGNFLLVDGEQGVTAFALPDGKKLWTGPWHFLHTRWNLGAWYQGGALYVDSKNGLARIDVNTGKVLWSNPELGEIELVRQYDDGRIYVGYIYLSQKLRDSLTSAGQALYQTAKFHFNVVPYRDTYFAYSGPLEDKNTPDNAVWERKNDQWKLVFRYPVSLTDVKSLNALYAKYQFSPTMRRRLTTRSYDGPLPSEP